MISDDQQKFWGSDTNAEGLGYVLGPNYFPCGQGLLNDVIRSDHYVNSKLEVKNQCELKQTELAKTWDASPKDSTGLSCDLGLNNSDKQEGKLKNQAKSGQELEEIVSDRSLKKEDFLHANASSTLKLKPAANLRKFSKARFIFCILISLVRY